MASGQLKKKKDIVEKSPSLQQQPEPPSLLNEDDIQQRQKELDKDEDDINNNVIGGVEEENNDNITLTTTTTTTTKENGIKKTITKKKKGSTRIIKIPKISFKEALSVAAPHAAIRRLRFRAGITRGGDELDIVVRKLVNTFVSSVISKLDILMGDRIDVRPKDLQKTLELIGIHDLGVSIKDDD